jgi:peroxiredoxin
VQAAKPQDSASAKPTTAKPATADTVSPSPTTPNSTERPQDSAGEPTSTRPSRPWLGIDMRLFNGEVHIEYVHAGSPAERVGLLPDDVLLRLGDRGVTHPRDVRRLVGNLTPGSPLPIVVRRGSATRLFKATVGREPDREALLHERYVGKPAPTISSLRAIQGATTASWNQLQGKVVVLEFWASWCPGCRGLTPVLNEWRARKEAMGFQVIGITMDPFEQASLDAKTLGIEYPLFFDEEGAVTRAYSAAALPMVLLVDRNAVVRDVMVGFQPSRTKEFELAIQKLLSE